MAINRNVLVWQMGYLFLVFALPLFLSAGTIAWFAGWSFLVLFFSFVLALTSWLLKYNPELLKERMTISRADQKAWDKVFLVLMFVFFIAWLILILPEYEQDVRAVIEGRELEEHVFDHIPTAMDVQSYRRGSAQARYQQHAPQRSLPPARGKLKPTDYDAAAAKKSVKCAWSPA